MLVLRTGCSLTIQWQKQSSRSRSRSRSPVCFFSLCHPPLSMLAVNVRSNLRKRIIEPIKSIQHLPVQEVDYDDDDVETEALDEDEEQNEEEGADFGASERWGREEKDYDKDPEFGEILGNYLDEPEKAQAKLEERIRKKRNKILHTKTGSATPMKVIFNKFDFSNSYIWFEFHHALLPRDISLLCDTIRSWHIIGRLGGCNCMNMQLSQSNMDKRLSYDAILGANVTPTTFYNIGDFEVQENLARIWTDIGTSEPLLLDTLINALTQISSDYVGIKKVVFGGSEFEDWRENFTLEDAGCSIHKI